MDKKKLENIELHYLPHHRKLALEIAYGLDDIDALHLHLLYATQYPKEFLLKMFDKVMKMPDYKITTSRGAYYNFLVNKYGKEYNYTTRN
jgi:hypothetical protein